MRRRLRTTTQPPTSALRESLRIAGIYAVVGGLWILFSDKALATFTDHPMAQTIKGWFFIIATAVMLYALIHAKLKSIVATEHKLRTQRQWLSTVIHSVGDAVIATDNKSRITLMNPVAEQLTGCSAEESRGRDLEEVFVIVNEQTLHPIETPVAVVLREQRVVGLANHTALFAKDGTYRPIADSGAPIMDEEGNIHGVVLVFRDMTEARQEEAQLRQQQKLEAIGTLASGIAHEINNPLNIIMNYAQIIDDQVQQPEKVQRFAGEIQNEGKRLADIVHSLLSFARIETKPVSSANIRDIIHRTNTLMRGLIMKEAIDLQVDIPADLPPICCRPQQIQQVLLNLVTNARDALNQKYPGSDPDKIITISGTTIEWKESPCVRITVEDHGDGIPPDIAERIFDPFFTTKESDKGTGLGLSLSHGIIEEHEGRLLMESKAGQYTRFHMDLPVADATSECSDSPQ